MEDNNVLAVTPDVSWIGVMDKDIVTFDVVMETRFGTTYNSYFINSGKKTIVDTVKEKYWDQYLAKIRQVTNPEEIEYIIANHTEPDHAGCIKNLLAIAPKARVLGSGNAIRYLTEILNCDFPHTVVKDGDVIDLGNKKLHVIGAPNLHWSDTIYTYLDEDKVLFSCDSFGSHYCHDEMYQDKVGNFDQSFTYYFNVILKPFSKFMLKAIEKIRPLNINAICPGHGPLLTKDWKKYVDLSEQYSMEYLKFPLRHKVYIPYVSAYKKTEILAKAIADGIHKAGDIEVIIQDIEHTESGEINMHLVQCSGLIVGCPVINQNILLPVYKLFAYISPIRDKGKLAGCFGSYGWSGENAKLIEINLNSLKLNIHPGGPFIKFSPSDEDLKKSVQYGFEFGQKLLELKPECGT